MGTIYKLNKPYDFWINLSHIKLALDNYLIPYTTIRGLAISLTGCEQEYIIIDDETDKAVIRRYLNSNLIKE